MRFITLICILCTLGLQSMFGQTYTYKRNFAEALQKSIYFYDAEMCGTGITGGELMWRGDCHLSDTAIPLEGVMAELAAMYPLNIDPDGDGTVDVSGGYHDAGDHVKFGLPQTYASQTLEWGLYEFREAFEETGQLEHMQAVLRRFSDYYLKSTFWDYDGNVVAFC